MVDREGKISTPRYLKDFTNGMLDGMVDGTRNELSRSNDDLDQLITKPDKALNSSKMSKTWGMDLRALSKYSKISSANSDN